MRHFPRVVTLCASLLGAILVAGLASQPAAPSQAVPSFDIDASVAPATTEMFQHPDRATPQKYICNVILRESDAEHPLGMKVETWPEEPVHQAGTFGRYRYELDAMVSERQHSARIVVSIHEGKRLIARQSSKVQFRPAPAPPLG